MALYNIPDGAHADIGGHRHSGDGPGDTPSGRLYKALVESKKAASTMGGVMMLSEPGVMLYRRYSSKGARPGGREADDAATSSRRHERAADEGRSRARKARRVEAAGDGFQRQRASRADAERADFHGRLAACCSSTATTSRRSLPKTCCVLRRRI